MTKRHMFLKMVISSFIRRRARLMIAVLAITIGATTLSGLVTIYHDIPRQLGKEFRSYGANLIILPKGNGKIVKEEFDKVKTFIEKEKKVEGIAPYRYVTTRVNEQPYIIAGTDLEQAKKNSPFWYINGKWTKNIDDDGVMIGKELAQKLDLKIGDKFTMKGVKVGQKATASSQTNTAEENKKKDIGSKYFSKKVIVKGIVTTGGKEEGFIFMNIDNLSKLVGDNVKSDVIECSIESNLKGLEKISKHIDKNTENLSARPVRRVTQSQDIVLNKLEALVYIVTLIVLIITMISVTTTMMAMVAERTKEIGLKKALGAENSQIVKEFIGEGIVLGAIGGIFGVILGFLFAHSVSLSVFGRAINFQWYLAPLTIMCAILVTVLASLWPIRKVLDVHPAIVLRGE